MLSDTQLNLSEPHLRETTTHSTKSGIFTTTTTRTVVSEALGKDGEVTNTDVNPPEELEARGLTAGSQRAATAVGSALGSMIVKGAENGVRRTQTLDINIMRRDDESDTTPVGLEIAERDGSIIVMHVEPESPSQAAGIERNDIIELLNGKNVSNDLANVKACLKINCTVRIARVLNENGLELRKDGGCAVVSAAESFGLGTAGAIAAAAKTVPGATAAVAAAAVVSIAADAARGHITVSNGGAPKKKSADMTPEQKKLEEKRYAQGRQRKMANASMSVGTTLAITATSPGRGAVAAAACITGAVLRERMLNEHAKEADSNHGENGRSMATRVADVGCAVAPALAPLAKQVSKKVPGALAVGAMVEGAQAVAAAVDGYRKGLLSGEETVHNSGEAVVGCAAGVAAASSSTLAATSASLAAAAFVVAETGAIATSASIIVPATIMPLAAYAARKIYKFVWRWFRGDPERKKMEAELVKLCNKYNIKSRCRWGDAEKALRRSSRDCHPDSRAKHARGKSNQERKEQFIELTGDFERIRELREKLEIADTPSERAYFDAVMDMLRNFSKFLWHKTTFGRGLCIDDMFRSAADMCFETQAFITSPPQTNMPFPTHITHILAIAKLKRIPIPGMTKTQGASIAASDPTKAPPALPSPPPPAKEVRRVCMCFQYNENEFPAFLHL